MGFFLDRLRHRGKRSNNAANAATNTRAPAGSRILEEPSIRVPDSSTACAQAPITAHPTSSSSPSDADVGERPRHVDEPSTRGEYPDVKASSLPDPAPAVSQPPADSVKGLGAGARADSLLNDAYHQLRTGEDTAKLAEIYEKVLTSISNNNIGEGGYLSNNRGVIAEANQYASEADVPNKLEKCDNGHDRAAQMRDISMASLRAAKRHEAVHSGAKQVLDFVKSVEGVVGSALAAYPPASFVWVGICAILPVVVSPSTQRLAMVEGLSHVMEKTEWYQTLSRLSLTIDSPGTGVSSLTEMVKNKVLQLFKALLAYEMKCVCSCYEGVLTRVIKSLLVDNWKAQLETIKALEGEVDGLVLQHGSVSTTAALRSIDKNTSSVSTIVADIKALRSQNEEDRRAQVEMQRLELIAKFSTETMCPYHDRMMANPERVPGTCEWFQAHWKFRDWLVSPQGGLLLLSADPGCGKSVLSRFLVETVLPRRFPRACITYFFFKDSSDQNNLSAALCALIHQILSSYPELVDIVRAAVVSNGNALTRKERSLWNIFERAVKALREGELGSPIEIVCVLDAMDECQREDRAMLVERLLHLLERNEDVQLPSARRNAQAGRMRFLVTTRGYPEIVDLFSQFSSGCIRLAGENKAEVDLIQSEIAMVAEYKLEQLAKKRGFTSKKRQQIRQSLMRRGGEQRTYLWVRVVFEVLEANLRDQLFVWNRLINEVPQTVYDAYEKLLARVGDVDRSRVSMLLRMMIAAYRPIPLATAMLLLDARDFYDNGTPEDDEEVEWEPEQSFRSWVIGTCGIFVTIYDGQLFFIHQTAKEFLLAKASAGPTRAGPSGTETTRTFRESITYKDAHKAMAENCLAVWKYAKKDMAGLKLMSRAEQPAGPIALLYLQSPVESDVEPDVPGSGSEATSIHTPTGAGGQQEVPGGGDAGTEIDHETDEPPPSPGVAAAPDRHRYCLEFWAQHFLDAQTFCRTEAGGGGGGGALSVGDVDEAFWPTYLEAWRDEDFIKCQSLRRFLRGHDPEADGGDFLSAGRRLDFVASYGHYRLLERELRARATREGDDESLPGPCFLPATWAQGELAALLFRHFPVRPVLVLSEPEEV